MSPKDLHHGFDHCQRVRNYAMQIAKTEKADCTILEIASYLHDIGRGHEKNQYHTKTSAKLAKTFLSNLGFPVKPTQEIVHCIETHHIWLAPSHHPVCPHPRSPWPTNTPWLSRRGSRRARRKPPVSTAWASRPVPRAWRSRS